MKNLYMSIGLVFLTPLLAYLTLQNYFPNDPEYIYVKEPSLFSGKWQKVAYSENFSEYIESSKIENNYDSTIDIVTLRNYNKLQQDDYTQSNQKYRSQISYETINCFNQTIIVTKIFLLGGAFSNGPLISEPISPKSIPIHVNDESIGFRKIRKVCELANLNPVNQKMSINFMSNI